MNEQSSRFKFEVIVSNSLKPEEGMIWMFYALALSGDLRQRPALCEELFQEQSGVIRPTFELESFARFMLAQSCDNHLKNGKELPSAYLVDFHRVHQANFLPEYVWWFLGRPSWPAEQQPANLIRFMAWAAANLRKHVAETRGGVRIISNDSPTAQADARHAVDVQPAGGSNLTPLLVAINAAIQASRFDEAVRLHEMFEAAVRTLKTEADATYVSLHSPRQVGFFVESRPDLRKIRLLAWCVATGAYLKGVISSECQRFEEALANMEAAEKLAPLSAQVFAHKGFVLSRLGRPQEALAAYSHAWDLAARLSDNAGIAGFILHGLGRAHARLGNLDRAEKLLNDSLLLEPGNAVTRDELMLISRQRESRPVAQ